LGIIINISFGSEKNDDTYFKTRENEEQTQEEKNMSEISANDFSKTWGCVGLSPELTNRNILAEGFGEQIASRGSGEVCRMSGDT